MINNIYETLEQAIENAYGDESIVEVCGGYATIYCWNVQAWTNAGGDEPIA